MLHPSRDPSKTSPIERPRTTMKYGTNRLTLLGLTACTVGCAAPVTGGVWTSTSPGGVGPADNPRVSTAASLAQAPEDRGETSRAPDAQALAKQLSNPVAALISVPFQLNYDDDIGPSQGERWTLNVQPVVPISLDADWNLISRTILPLIDQEDIPTGEDEFGTGDIVQSLFFSPVAPTVSGWIWGAGPVFLIPTASDEFLGGEQWGVGPTGVALKQDGPWTYGALANHIWSFAGEDDRADVNATFLQPFLSYTTPEAVTFTFNSEATYDWSADDLALPVNGVVSKVMKVGGQLISVGGGLRYWVEESEASPEGWGLRFFVTLLFPK